MDFSISHLRTRGLQDFKMDFINSHFQTCGLQDSKFNSRMKMAFEEFDKECIPIRRLPIMP